MVEGTDGPEAEALTPSVSSTGRRRRALWGALAVLAVAAGGLAVVANDDSESPRLPVALGSANPESRSAAPAAADMAMYAPVHYVAGDDLPLLGGSQPAYKVSGKVDEAAVRRLAAALDVSGTPVHEESSWRVVGSEDGFLEVYEGGGGSWWYSSEAPRIEPDFGTNDGSDACPPDATECAARGSAGTTGSGASGDEGSVASPPASIVDQPTPDCDAGKCIDPVDPEPFVPPADLPTKDEAKAIALDLFAATGSDLELGKVTVDGPYEAWYVSIEPMVDGLPVSGLYFNASVGSKGEITSAGGVLNAPERLGDYPTVDTRTAIERLNDGVAYGGGREAMDLGDSPTGSASGGPDTAIAQEEPAIAKDDPTTTVLVDPTTDPPVGATEPIDPSVGVPEPGVACASAGIAEDDVTSDEPTLTTSIAPLPECPPYEPPEPVDVVLHQAERILVLVGANDGSSDAYLVPGYRMRGDNDTIVDVPAVDDDSLLPAPAVTSDVAPEPRLADE